MGARQSEVQQVQVLLQPCSSLGLTSPHLCQAAFPFFFACTPGTAPSGNAGQSSPQGAGGARGGWSLSTLWVWLNSKRRARSTGEHFPITDPTLQLGQEE